MKIRGGKQLAKVCSEMLQKWSMCLDLYNASYNWNDKTETIKVNELT